MIITSGYIKDMKITQELLKKSAICMSRYLLNRSSICQDSLKLNTCLDLLRLQDSNYSQQRFYCKRLFVYGFAQSLLDQESPRFLYTYLEQESSLSSYLNKEVEKEKPNPRELHKVFFLKPQPPSTEERVLFAFLVHLWVL